MNNEQSVRRVRKVAVFVGGARKTCTVKEQGFPKFASECARFFLTERRERFDAALQSGRKGHVLPHCEASSFELSADEKALAESILHALEAHPEFNADETDTRVSSSATHKPFGVDTRFHY